MKSIDVYWIRHSRGVGRQESLTLREQIIKQRYGRDLPVGTDGRGKPRFLTVGEFFSVSHSGPYYLMAFCEGSELGLDVEQKVSETLRREAVARRFFSREEQARIENAPDPRGEFTRVWTQREAYAKFTGEGLGGLSRPRDPNARCVDLTARLQEQTGATQLYGSLVYEGEYEIKLWKGTKG